MDDDHDDAETSVRKRPAAQKIIAAKRQKLQDAMKGDMSLDEGKDKTSAKGVELNAQEAAAEEAPQVLQPAAAASSGSSGSQAVPQEVVAAAAAAAFAQAQQVRMSRAAAPDFDL
eukprot:4617022-Pyramimonas_sp.AAC.2